jgi:aerobic C4-dicarboxylate transport protein
VKVIPIEGLALLLGVDRFMSEARAITNFIGNGVATVFISCNEGLFDKARMHKAFHHKFRQQDAGILQTEKAVEMQTVEPTPTAEKTNF